MGNDPNNSFLFIISSVIYFKDKPLSYSATRSKFTFSEREAQTLQSIRSIRTAVPQATIVLIESGYKEEISPVLRESVDQFIYTGNHAMVRLASDSSKKGLGEAMSLFVGLKKIRLSASHRYAFKLSGRYFLNEEFTLDAFDFDKDFNGKRYTSPEQISTRLFGFSPALMPTLRKMLMRSFRKLYLKKSIEELLYTEFSHYRFSEVARLGVSGLIGPTGDIIKE